MSDQPITPSGVDLAPVERRCPFCHEPAPTDGPLLVCEQCLAPHHVECWRELGRCSACKAEAALGQAVPAPSRSALAAVVIGLALFGGWLWSLLQPPPKPTFVQGPPPPLASPSPPPPPPPMVRVEPERPPPPAYPRVDPPRAIKSRPLPDVAVESVADVETSDCAVTLALEGEPDPGYRPTIVLAPGPPIGGDEPAPAWSRRPALPNHVANGLPILAERARLIVYSVTEVAALVGGELRRERLGSSIHGAVARSGNRILIAPYEAARLRALDVDTLAPVAEVELPSTARRLLVCEDEPRRVVAVLDDGVALIDAGRLRVVERWPSFGMLQQRMGARGGPAWHVDPRGRWFFHDDGAETRLLDLAHGLRRQRVGPTAVAPAPGGRLLVGPSGTFDAGSFEPVGAVGGAPLGRLTDGRVLLFDAATRRLSALDAATGSAQALEPRGIGDPRGWVRMTLLAGTNRLIFATQGELQVLDLPVDGVALPASPAPRTRAPARVFVGDEWSWTVDAPGAEVRGPPGLSWDGTTARWRPTQAQLGDHAVTVTCVAPGHAPRVVSEPVQVRQRFVLLPEGAVALPSQRLVVWFAGEERALVALDPATLRARRLSLRGCASFAELGDSLWVALGSGELVELSLPGLEVMRALSIEGVTPSALAATRRGELSWFVHTRHQLTEPRSTDALVGVIPAGGAASPAANLGELHGEAPALHWLDGERFAVRIGQGAQRWRWRAGTIEREAGTHGWVACVLPDGTSVAGRRVLRPDGSTLRDHAGRGREGVPGLSHDGRSYAHVEPGPGGLLLRFYALPDGALAASIPLTARPEYDPSPGRGLRGLLLLSRYGIALVGGDWSAPRCAVVPYDPATWTGE